ncbi:DUF456 domain-containing protein [Sinomonas sp. ASV486]|uniref:DUF456 domain-containing protein n=1 Tax=Sinomonas puerhi TaxID=3238584 RepID=A0AB39L3W0_9MICC|nr:DUF456 domain-containing protein [Sinomonas sp. ASV486]MDQ4489196.1 DUF456 domain-containing protein [Sinomonas sp. ASV486]
MDTSVLAALLCGAALAVSLAGIIIPVLPGSILGLLALLEWALFGGAGWGGWLVFALGGALFACGMGSSAFLTGRRLRQRSIPGRSVVIGAVLAIIGMFIVPVVGLVLGFALGLFLSEWQRAGHLRGAASSSWAALKATGLGILVEFGFACAAASVWVIGLWVHFATR